VVGNHQVAGLQEVDEPGAGGVGDLPLGIDHEQFRLRRTLDGTVGGDHAVPPSLRARACGSAAAMASASSRAAISGRFSVAGSASGTAAACNGVSMSPGSIDRNRTPTEVSSASQIALRWRRAALLALYAPHRG